MEACLYVVSRRVEIHIREMCIRDRFFAVLRVGSTTMQAATGVPTSVSALIQALVIVFSVAGMALTKLPEFQAWKDRVFPKRKAGAT